MPEQDLSPISQVRFDDGAVDFIPVGKDGTAGEGGVRQKGLRVGRTMVWRRCKYADVSS
jgi:hypothetical protein